MKICENCKKGFTDDKIFCPECGKKLIAPVETDIFGEPFKNAKKQDDIIYDENKNAYYSAPKSVNIINNFKDIKHELFSLLSIGFMLVPLYGIILSGVALFSNLNHYNATKKGLGYLILTIITVIISVVFTVLLIKFGVLEDMMKME